MSHDKKISTKLLQCKLVHHKKAKLLVNLLSQGYLGGQGGGSHLKSTPNQKRHKTQGRGEPLNPGGYW